MHDKKHKIDSAAFRTFLFQGKALFTLHNVEDNTHITFRVQSLKRKRGQPENTRDFEVFVKALNDGYTGNRYIGRIDRKNKSFTPYKYIDQNHVGIQTVRWLIKKWTSLESYENSGKLAIYHLGSCCKCGMTLTVPESIQNGIGPHCMKYRENSSLELLKELGLYDPDKKYDDLVMEALDVRPDLFDKLFVSDVVRRTSDWFNKMTSYSEFGLF